MLSMYVLIIITCSDMNNCVAHRRYFMSELDCTTTAEFEQPRLPKDAVLICRKL